MSEKQLLEGIILGRQSAFSAFFDSHWKDLYTYVKRLVGDADESVDIVQDTFAALWLQRDRLANVQSLKGYLYAVAHHKVVLFIKKSVRHRHYLDAMADYFTEAVQTAEEELDARDLAAFIHREIEKLPPRMRAIFLLSRFDHLSYREIAAELSIAENTVRKQISLSLKHLRMRLDQAY